VRVGKGSQTNAVTNFRLTPERSLLKRKGGQREGGSGEILVGPRGTLKTSLKWEYHRRALRKAENAKEVANSRGEGPSDFVWGEGKEGEGEWRL